MVKVRYFPLIYKINPELRADRCSGKYFRMLKSWGYAGIICKEPGNVIIYVYLND